VKQYYFASVNLFCVQQFEQVFVPYCAALPQEPYPGFWIVEDPEKVPSPVRSLSPPIVPSRQSVKATKFVPSVCLNMTKSVDICQ
jgi:hypothetical protein